MSNTPELILQLVETFDRNIDNFKKQNYNEAQVRQQFINPFFEALGWDMQNKAGIALAYSDVIHEDAIKIGSATKAPDYCFRIGGTRKFFLEAKKPSVDIKSDVSPAYQLRRYAWSAKLPLSILTDFEEFAVYDCQIRPNVNDKPSTARIFFCGYKEYGDKWEQIAKIFSKEAVYKGLFDKYASEKTTKRGTTTVDKEFLAEIEEWRNDLAKNIAIRNSKLSVYDLNFAVQKTIDRILFLRICEDRGIERNEQLLGLINGSRIYPRLFELFEKADEKYNSGIFHFRREKDRPESPDELSANLKVDDDVLKKIIRDLYYPCPYEFSIMPAEILGNVYEQFLGKVIRLTASHQAKVEEKPEVKKAGGVYYTPSYIVDYIVKNTVGKLCEKKTPKQISKLKILDPACGSGSFLIGAYQYLLDYHRDYYEKERSKYKKVIYQGKGGQWFLTIAEKKRILLNNIFGVDIDSQAVEVSKLSLLLKVLKNETAETLKLFHERALPDLGSNIKCGNSLIGPDFYQNQQLSLFGDDQQRKINVFDWQKEFPEILPGKNPGFDAVIGNPPYVDVRKIDPFSKKFFFDKYTCVENRTNTFAIFLELAISISRQGGFSGFIIPNTILTHSSYRKLRQQILNQCTIPVIYDLGSSVFKKATVDTIILILTRDQNQDERTRQVIEVYKRDKNNNLQSFKTKQKHFYSDFSNRFILRVDDRIGEIISKCKILSISLGEIYHGFNGINPGNIRHKVVVDKKIDERYRKVIDGKNIKRYRIHWEGDWVLYDRNILERARREEIFLAKPKLMLQKIGNSLVAALDDQQLYALINTTILLRQKGDYEPKFILGLLNSNLLNFFYKQEFVGVQIKTEFLHVLPIRQIDFNNPDYTAKHDQMVTLVERMLELHKKVSKIKNPDEKTRIQRQIDSTDSEIDKLVYELYGLTDEEIRIVEEG